MLLLLLMMMKMVLDDQFQIEMRSEVVGTLHRGDDVDGDGRDVAIGDKSVQKSEEKSESETIEIG